MIEKRRINMDNEKIIDPAADAGGEKRKRSGKKITVAVTVVGFIAVTVALIFLAQAILVPKYNYTYEEAIARNKEYGGGMVAEYYDAETSHDVIFLGDCEFFESISPVELWEKYGISSYVRGSPQQLIWHSYYFLLDTLLYEKPKVVVFNAMEMKIGEVQSEAYTRLTLDGLKLSKYKIEAAKMSLSEEGETVLSYVFPILRYHSRWQELTADDFRYAFDKGTVTYNGYLMVTDGCEKESVAPPAPLKMVDFPPICYEYLDKIKALCDENDIEFLLFKAPTQSGKYYWYEEWERLLDEYTEKNSIRYVNGIEFREQIGFNMLEDSYDGGIHLNVNGAEKCTRFLGEILKNEYGLEDKRSDEKYAKAWAGVCERYHNAKIAAGLEFPAECP